MIGRERSTVLRTLILSGVILDAVSFASAADQDELQPPRPNILWIVAENLKLDKG